MPAEKRVRTLSVDMTNAVDRRSGPPAIRVAEGDYLMKVKDAYFTKVASGNNAGKDQVLWECQITKPASQAGPGILYHRTGVWPEQIWSFRNMVEDIRGGKALPKRMADIDLSKYVGMEFGATLIDGNEFKGKIKSEIAATFPAAKYEEAGATEDEDEEDAEDAEEDEIESVDDDDI